jgi:long-chain acyl-CoA synthetase
VSGGAPLAYDVAQRFEAATGRTIRQGYGLTETAPVLTMGRGSTEPASIGRPVPGVEVRLVAADGSTVAAVTADGLRSLPAQRSTVDVDGAREPTIEQSVDDDAFDEAGTDAGEIVVRGQNLFRGYWPSGAGGPDVDGWWATGDVAYAEPDGDLFLVDRLIDLIIVNGFNVYPQEVEHVLLAHPGVAEAAVVGVPDPVTGEAVHAYFVPAGGGASVEELRDHCGRNLARYKCPATYEVVDALPRSAVGKVRKGSLRHPAPETVA